MGSVGVDFILGGFVFSGATVALLAISIIPNGPHCGYCPWGICRSCTTQRPSSDVRFGGAGRFLGAVGLAGEVGAVVFAVVDFFGAVLFLQPVRGREMVHSRRSGKKHGVIFNMDGKPYYWLII